MKINRYIFYCITKDQRQNQIDVVNNFPAKKRDQID